MYQGQSIQARMLDDGIAELCFNSSDDAVNKFDARTRRELGEAVAAISSNPAVQALVVSSGKDAFIVGADITEFGKAFQGPEAELIQSFIEANALFSAVEDLPFPSVTAINGIALGGGLEMALTTDYRVASTKAVIGFPEVKLGLIPGYGGTVRLPRVIGADHALAWMSSGEAQKADAALKMHAVDAVVAPEKLMDASLAILRLALSGAYDWKARRAQKMAPLKLDATEAAMVFMTARTQITLKAGKHLPAPLAALESVEKGAGLFRDAALLIENGIFARLAKTPTANALTGLFLNDQLIKRKGKQLAKIARPVKHAAVLGAGIMGGGIAYQSASRGIPIVMKDIADKSLEIGMSEANKLLSKQVLSGKLKPEKAGAILGSIRPTMNYGDFQSVDAVIEAVVENPKVKKAVLAEIEGIVRPDTVITSNTSSISIDELASGLKRPENFLGMHFFNPVHRMQLVEVIKGAKTSPESVATIVSYATAMGKTPIVVNNCAGFLVNRILFPYLGGFLLLVRDGIDFAKCDRAMENLGWPMGPAYLEDVVGLDTCFHVGEILAEGYPDRMRNHFRTANDVMFEAKRFGQKSGAGFYKYEMDPKGRPKKSNSDEAYTLIAAIQPNGVQEFSEEDVIDRMMLPMIIETARCVEEGIVETPNEADMGLILGLGFPAHLGGALKYADQLGLKTVIDKCAKHVGLGPLYEPTARMREMAARGESYYSL